MATNVSYPGVYIQEVPSGVRTIAGVPTSVAAFVGYTARGPVNSPVQIFSFADFERQFGGLDRDSDLSYAVSHFFLNGGGTAWIVRVAAGAMKASVEMLRATGGHVLTASAIAEGAWGNGLRVMVDHDTSNPASLFNLYVEEVQDRNGSRQVVRSEVHRNLSMNGSASNYAVATVNSSSNLIRLERPAGLTSAVKGTARSGEIINADLGQIGDNARRLAISVDGGRTYEFDLFEAGATPSSVTVADLATAIQGAVRDLEPGNPAFDNFDCVEDPAATGFLLATSGTGTGETASVAFFNAGIRNAAGILHLGLLNGGRETAAAAGLQPAPTGTVWARGDPIDPTTIDNTATTAAGLVGPAGGVAPVETLALWPGAAPNTLEGVRAALQAALNGVSRPEFQSARVSLIDDTIVVAPGSDFPAYDFEFAVGPMAGTDDLSAGSRPNVAAYQLGIGPLRRAQSTVVPGFDGTQPSATDIAGSRLAKTGLYALEDVDLFNILVLPNQWDVSLQAEAIAYAEKRRAFALLDLKGDIDTLPEATAWLAANGGLRHKNAAAYFPRVQFADPLQNNRVRSFANSGAIAGLYARTDAERGVWKAPAGTDAGLRGVRGLDYVLTDGENGVINPLGLNAIRSSPAFGPIAWGARTLVGSDMLASEWKYIPVRRLALFLEESLYRGTQWVVFEPNDEPLWAQIRLNVGAFMHTLFRQGAFQGITPKDAYLVQCDSTTTTHDDINLGIVNIIVGFAPLKPAEFVIIKLQQLAGQDGA
ncbi:MAG: uncharacterized protein QOG13_304 [Sphingomonadales bacterium]|jgi:phage tail sheath protein FI|nr:uncharacterized protein [Sphingomonadales bacterium]